MLGACTPVSCAAFHEHQVYGLPVNSIRIFTVRFSACSLSRGWKGSPSPSSATAPKGGTLLYITDVARVFLKAAVTEITGALWSLGAGKPQSVNWLVELLGAEGRFEIPKRPGEPDVTWADVTKIATDLEWQPDVSFENGVAEILEKLNIGARRLYGTRTPSPRQTDLGLSIWSRESRM